MKKWIALSLLPVCGIVMGVWLARNFFPRQITTTVVKTEVEKLPPDVREKVLTDTVTVTKWRQRVVEKIRWRESPPETVTVYREKIPPSRYKALITDVDYSDEEHVRYNTYSLADSTVTHWTHAARNGWQLWIDQRYGVPRLRERRNWVDGPMLTLGWLSREGPFLAAQMRLWKLYPMARATQEGISAGAGVKMEF